MYLKSIEVHGFKSFANKINFKFHNGITGIVGPNGSGKSNVADAVRWVLGEQRVKQLRGGSMQDVIFSGTEMRKPLSYAYVAITLDNSDHQLNIDFDEVTVSRRLYRSGESEYMINETPCRLKDVNELFYDTGIGKEGYSIIGQGQVEKILNGKPEERRELFDEAAGIVTYKKRKYATQKKLEDAQNNLVRINDILAELEKQRGPLERQSEKARIYLKKKEELKTYDVNVFLLENVSLREQLAQTEKNYTIASDDLKQTNEQYQSVRNEHAQIQQQIELLEESIEKGRSTLSETGIMKSKLESEIALLNEQINSIQGNEEHLQNRITNIQEQIDSKNLEKDKILEEKDAIDSRLSEIEEERNGSRVLLEEIQNKIMELNMEIESGKNTLLEALNERATIKAKMGRIDSRMEQINIRKAGLNSKLLKARSDEAEHKENIKKLEELFEAINLEIIELNEKQKNLEETLEEKRKEVSELQRKQQDTQNQYSEMKSKLDVLSNLTERYDGYGGSVKAVMEQKDSEKGIIGVVADIIKVEAKYETAIETALGGNIQNIVTEDEETAKHMIAYLKKAKAGRATFLPLTSITHPQEFKNPDALKEKGVIGMADELVDIDKKYKNVAKAMLGRIVVVDNVDNAVKIARKFDYGIRMVTLEGELLVPGGAISGGAFKSNSNLLGRRREIETLEKKITELSAGIRKIEEDIETAKKERNRISFENEDLKAQINRKFIEQNTAKMNVDQAKEKKDEYEAGFGELKSEELDIEKELTEIQLEKEAIRQQLMDSEALEESLKNTDVKLQKELEKKREQETEQSAKVSNWDLTFEKMRQNVDFMQQNLNRVDAELAIYKKDLDEVKDGLLNGKDSIELKQKSIEEIRKTIEASFTTKTEAEKKLNDDMEEKEKLSQKVKNFFKTTEELQERIIAIEKDVYRLDELRKSTSEKMDRFINYMWDEYEITLSDAEKLKDDSMTDLGAMKNAIKVIKEAIKNLGNVNVNAIEEYKELMERYTFLTTQHDDIIEAKKSLEKIIEELDTTMRQQFNEKFAEINREFDKVFKELFGGGKGTLELMEDEDILEAGIRIIAQPPGKKLINMMQMSGGEKSLTAISLLFAIQNLKPSPFCLLDEIEAALDESNVTRFAKYLHKLTKNTQFIVITHRRGTMEKADRLYGITMQEKGVSTLVSVNLIDKELDN